MITRRWAGWKPESDRAVTVVWACWTLPLLVTEVILHLKRIPKQAAMKS